MLTRKAASVFPEPVGAEIRVGSPRRIGGQPKIWGSVGDPNLDRNHSAVTGMRPLELGRDGWRWAEFLGRGWHLGSLRLFVVCSLHI